MKRTYIFPAVVLIVAAVILSACGASFQIGQGNNPAPTAPSTAAPAVQQTASPTDAPVQQANVQPVQAQQPAAASQPPVASNSLASAYQSMLEGIYTAVNPSIVSIHV